MRISSVSVVSPVFQDQQKSIQCERSNATMSKLPEGIEIARKMRDGSVLRIIVPWSNIAWYEMGEEPKAKPRAA